MKFVKVIAVVSGGKSVKPVLPAAGTGSSAQRQPALVCQFVAAPAFAALLKLNRSATVASTESRALLRGGLLLRTPRDILFFAFSTEFFPLTLTLSLREREQHGSDWCLADGRWANSGTGVIERRRTILPLPRGEGRGEGEPSVVHPAVQSV